MPRSYDRYFNYLDTAAGQIHYWTAGEGPNLLMLHQSGNSSEEYAAIVPFLANDFRIIAVDLPGHGRTYDPVTQPHVKDYAAAVKHVLDALEVQETHVVGHHGGALTAMALLGDQPERFERVILSGVDEEYLPEDKQALITRIKNTDIKVRESADFVADAWVRYQDMRSDGATPELAIKPFMAFLDARLRTFRAVLTNLSWDRRDTIAKLRGPILMVTGEKDSYVVKQERLMSMIPDCEYIELAGGGTFMFYDYAEPCSELIRSYILGSE